jgi:truncated hemoglobin YjbI
LKTKASPDIALELARALAAVRLLRRMAMHEEEIESSELDAWLEMIERTLDEAVSALDDPARPPRVGNLLQI